MIALSENLGPIAASIGRSHGSGQHPAIRARRLQHRARRRRHRLDTQRNPTCPVDVSIGCAWRAAGR